MPMVGYRIAKDDSSLFSYAYRGNVMIYDPVSTGHGREGFLHAYNVFCSRYGAYDGMNNTFNLAYTMLKWRVHRAVLGAKLEPYLGFVHSEQYGKPSLVCDLMELYRYLIDDFLVGFFKMVGKKDFVVKGERTTRKRWGKREYLNGSKTRELERGLDELFGGMVEVPRIRHGSRQTH